MLARPALCTALAISCSLLISAHSIARAEPSTAAKSTSAKPASAKTANATTASAAVASLGKKAPDFTLTDVDGKTHTLSALRGKTVVLEWFNPECPFVKAAHGQGDLKTMAKKLASKDLVWLSINSAAPGKQGHGADRNRAARSEFAMEHPILLDENGTVGQAYGAEKTPHLFIIDPKGVLVYRGGIDNAPMNVVDDARPRPSGQTAGSRFNYVEAALAELAKGKQITFSDTPAYGCSVKYAG
jgi:peroxiredoxin